MNLPEHNVEADTPRFEPLSVRRRGFGGVAAWIIGLGVVFALLTRLPETAPLVLEAPLVLGLGVVAWLRWRTIRGAVLRVHADRIVMSRASRMQRFDLPTAREGWIEHQDSRVVACVRTD